MQSLEPIDIELVGSDDFLEDKDETILTYNKDLLVSGGWKGNGGLYVVNPAKDDIQKMYDGYYAGLTKYNDGFMALKQPNNLYIFDKKLKVQEVLEVEDKSIKGLHDIKLSGDGFLYIISTHNNKIIVLDEKTLKKQREIILSKPGIDLHHINDLFITENSLLLSMFSVKGGWKGKPIEQWDGGIVEFDRQTFNPKGIIIDHLKAPHSITMKNNSLYYCDSLNLNVSKFDLTTKQKEIVTRFNGFTRGLYFDNHILVVGQSEMRHLQRLNNRFPNVSLDGGFHLYDCKSHNRRFIKLPVSNPYSIVPYY